MIINPYRYSVFANSMVAYWKLATNSNDSSGNGHNGTDTGIVYSSGYAGFGSGKYITFADSDDFSFTDGAGNDLAFAVLIPFYWTTKTGSQFWLNKRGASTNGEWQITSDGTLIYFTLMNSTIANLIYITFPISSITTGVLHTLFVQYDGSEVKEGLTAYLDASIPTLTRTLVGTYTGMTNGTSNVRMGETAWTTGSFFKGFMKEVAIWKGRTMDGTEITELHNRVIAGTPLI